MSSTVPAADSSQDFLESLLEEQQSLTAVERFSALHESGKIGDEPDQARYYRDLLPASPPGPDQQFGFQVDLDKCSGCKACVVACHTLNGLEEDESWRRVGTITIGGDEPAMDQTNPLSLPRVEHVTTACHHCEDPGCLNGCPVRAYEKDAVTGIVRHLDDQCIGCKYCTMMCPYEVPRYSDRLGIVRKCDMCHQRLSVGEAPACVQACPNEAIAITVVQRGHEFTAEDRLAPGAPVSTITRPTTQYVSSQTEKIVAGIAQDDGVDEVAESHWPLAVMLVATQASVGLIVAERLLATIWMVAGYESSIAVVRWSALLAWIIGAAGLNVAPLHLGQPLRAWRVFLGLRTSWLSREAVVLGKYMGCLTVAVGLMWMPVLAGFLPESLAGWFPAGVWDPGAGAQSDSSYPFFYRLLGKSALGFSVPLGLLGLYSSAMIYIATKRPLWRFSRTGLRFFGSAAVLGTACLAVVAAACGFGISAMGIGGLSFVLAAAKVGWEWQILLGPAKELLRDDGTQDFSDSDVRVRLDKRSQRLVGSHLMGWSDGRIKLAWVGLITLACGALVAPLFPIVAAVLFVAAMMAMHAGELYERLIYFCSVVYDRMPGTL